MSDSAAPHLVDLRDLRLDTAHALVSQVNGGGPATASDYAHPRQYLQGLIDGLCELSLKDPLTGLANRRHFRAVLEREIDRVTRSGEAALLLMLDIDIDPYASARVDEFDVTFMVAAEGFDANIVARPLMQGESIVVASPAYLERKDLPLQPQDLEHHDYLRDSSVARVHSVGGRKLRLLSDDGQRPAQDVDVPSVVLQSISTEVLMRAALDGMGVAVVPRLLAQEHLARSELVHLLPGWIFARYTVYAALPSGRMLPARTKVFLDFLSERVQELVQQRKLAQCCPGIDTVS